MRKALPEIWREDYVSSMDNPEILSSKEEIAVLRAMLMDQLRQVEAGNVNGAWIDVKSALDKLRKGIATGALEMSEILTDIQEISDLVLPHYQATRAAESSVKLINDKATIADKERRLLVDRQKMIPAVWIGIIIDRLLTAYRQIVVENTEKETARRILIESQNVYDEITADFSKKE